MNSWWTLLRAEWDRIVGVAFLLAGGVALFLGYQGVADSAFVSVQLPYIISGGLGGLFLCAIGVGLLVTADLHDEWRKLDRIEEAIRGEASDHRPAVSRIEEPEPAPALVLSRRQVVVASGLMVSAALLVAGWQRAAGTTRPDVGYQGMAVGALALVVMAAVISIGVLGLRSQLGRRRAGLLGGWWLVSMVARHQPGSEENPEATAEVAVGQGMRRFHQPDCPSLSGLEVTRVPRAQVAAGLQPCGLCGAR